MIICANKMEYPLRSQCQRVQKQVVVNGEKERVSLLFVKALVSRGSVDAVFQQMASHPQYLESFLRTQHYILHMDGPLPLPYRHYIAIMAAARHHCNYLVYLHSAQFLRVGGDPLWLQGLEAAPPRLRLLDHINKVLAHQPWLTACSHIQTLLKSGEQCWSLAELVQAVVILAHCHALCSFVFGCDTDSDFVSRSKSPNGTPPTYCPFDAANGNTNVPQSFATPSEHIRRRRSLDSSCDMICLKERIQKSQEQHEKREERHLQTQTLQQTDSEEEEEMMCFADPSRFITDPDFCYQEFARREEDHFQVFRVQDYSWEDHGFSLVNRLYSDIGHLLDDRFRSVTSLPSMHSSDLKRAIWNYIHCVLGIRYDDYDYSEVNHLLERDLKLYIKAVACFPDTTKTPVCPLSWALLKGSERIHVNLLIMEARLQAELLYALRAITQYMIA
ncbi:sestrin-3-like [Solea senegalensis]|uniref:Sestrin-3-like n=1 Tax=Solea senegalensis TaxID=28829 RepID=A0AAV6SN37_SOLSE|nr:sestrin-3 [Solea senegalensis]XP_058506225.1 sestrin-3 [Solea solea]KAG7518729.1 sestrin-3-like [Solea senegalensis]